MACISKPVQREAFCSVFALVALVPRNTREKWLMKLYRSMFSKLNNVIHRPANPDETNYTQLTMLGIRAPEILISRVQ
jgi:hypothetical protein